MEKQEPQKQEQPKQGPWKINDDGTTDTQSFNRWMYEDWKRTIANNQKLDNSNLSSDDQRKINDANNQKTLSESSNSKNNL